MEPLARSAREPGKEFMSPSCRAEFGKSAPANRLSLREVTIIRELESTRGLTRTACEPLSHAHDSKLGQACK